MKERKKQTEFKGKVSFDQENEQVKTYDDQTIQSDFLCESLSMDRETRRWRSTEAETAQEDQRQQTDTNSSSVTTN